MKFFLIFISILALNSCNTMIGMFRDTKQAVSWAGGKMQGDGGGTADDASGAPVY